MSAGDDQNPGSPDTPTETSHASSSGRTISKIGHYKIKREIATGGMGTVYEAVQDHPRRTVAVKVMKRGMTSRAALRRFEYESQMLARLRHPYIAQVYEAGTHQDEGGTVPYFAMEYIPNAKSLTRYAEDKKLDQPRAVGAVRQDLRRRAPRPSEGHRPPRPQAQQHPGGLPTGSPGSSTSALPAATDSDMALTTMQTSVGQLVGSLQYMSPEQCDADPHDLDTRSDVYSLGVTLYELVSGSLPYRLKGAPIHEAARIVREQESPSVSETDPALGGDVATIVSKALEKDRERRYQSAYGLAQDIRRFLTGEAIVARPPSIVYQLKVFARRNKILLGAVAAVFLVLVTGVVVSTSLYFNAETERDRAEDQVAKTRAAHDFVREMLAHAVPPGYGEETTIANMLEQSDGEIEQAFEGRPEIEAEIRRTMAHAHKNLGRYRDSEQHLRAALAIRREINGEDHPKTVELLEDLAFLYLVTGDKTGREEMLRALLGVTERAHGEEHPRTADAIASVADILLEQGRVDEAEELCLKALDISRRTLGDEHEDTLGSMVQHAWIRFHQGEIEEAEAMNRQLLETSRRVLGEDHGWTAVATSQLAASMIAQGRIAEAAALYGDASVPDELGIEKWFQGERELAVDGTQVFVFWETWCPFSQRAMPGLEDVHRSYGDQGLELYGLTRMRRSATEQKVVEFIDQKGLSFPIARENGAASVFFGVTGTPYAAVVRNGKLIWKRDVLTPEMLPEPMLAGLMRADPVTP